MNEAADRVAAVRETAASMQQSYRYDLGCLMRDIRKEPPDCPVLLAGWPGPEKSVAAPHCYRGNPCDLALRPVHSILSAASLFETLLEVLGEHLQDKHDPDFLGKRFMMPPGVANEYPIMKATLLWVSHFGEVSNIYPYRITRSPNHEVLLHVQERIVP